MKYNYAFKSDKENIVKIVGRDLGISTKQAIEICTFIKNLHVRKANTLLEKVRDKKVPVPFRRFTEGAGHKKGMTGGKFPFNTSKEFLKLLKALEANAQNKGLSSELKIIHACAQRASTPLRYGRKRRISMKRTHVEIVAEEIEHVKKEKKEKKDEKDKKAKEEQKEALKKEVKQEEKKHDEKKPEVKKEEKETEVKKTETKKVEVKK